MDHGLKFTPVVKVNLGDIIYYEEDVFICLNKRFQFAGKRVCIVKVEAAGTPGYAICKIIRSVGFNPFPIGSNIHKPVNNLMRGQQLHDITFNDGILQKGGHLEGTENGKKVVLATAEKGGMSVGASHKEDGIKGVVGTAEKPIEFEGREIILTAPVSENTHEYEFEGQKMTGSQIASKINVDNGGVAFAEGGISGKCRCSGKMYKFGGQTICDEDIIQYINFMNKPVEERILYLKSK